MDTSVKPSTSKERSDEMGQQDVSGISSHKIGELKAIIKYNLYKYHLVEKQPHVANVLQ